MKETLQRAFYSSLKSLKRSSPTILTYAGALGVVATAVMAVKATPKALELLDYNRRNWSKEILKDNEWQGKPFTNLDIFKIVWKCYIPTAMTGLASISCIFGANILNQKQQKAITGAYLLLDQSYKRYREGVKKAFGDDADAKVKEEFAKELYGTIKPEDGKQIYYEEHYDKFFERSKEDVINAEYQLNQLLVDKGYADLNDFYGFLNLEPTEEGACLGWSLSWLTDCNAKYGYSWVDFKHELITLDDGMECMMIGYEYPPCIEAMI